MANYNKRNKNSIVTVIAVILALLFIASVTLGLGAHFGGWFNPEDLHTYAVYKDETTEEVRAIETTHLYVPDKHNMDRLSKGYLYKVKFDGYETPSGVHNSYYNTDIEGKPIDLNKEGIKINKMPVSYKTAKDIKDFAKNPRNSD